MALTKRRAKMALAGYMAISGFTGCCGDSLMARYVEPILFTLLVAFVGLVVFAIAFAIMAKVAPSRSTAK